MSACITGSQGFAKVVCWLFTLSAQLCRKVCLLLLLLQTWSRSKSEDWGYLCNTSYRMRKGSYRIQRLQGHLCIYFISFSIGLNRKQLSTKTWWTRKECVYQHNRKFETAENRNKQALHASSHYEVDKLVGEVNLGSWGYVHPPPCWLMQQPKQKTAELRYEGKKAACAEQRNKRTFLIHAKIGFFAVDTKNRVNILEV